MDITTLREFAVLAERLNFTVAAREVNLSQSSLSRHIGDLERELGTQLFSREDKLSLTPDGEILLEEAGSFFAVDERLRRRLAESKAAQHGKIKLEDYFFSQEVKNLLVCAVNRFHEAYPGVSFEFLPVKEGSPIVESLDTGYLDVGILVHCGEKKPDFTGEPDCRYMTVPLYHAQSPLGIYLQKEILPEPLRESDTVSVEVLKDIPVVLPLRPEYGNFRNDMTAICRGCGFEPTFLLRKIRTFEELATMDMTGCAQVVLVYDVSSPLSPFLIDKRCKFYRLSEERYATPYLLFPREGGSDLLYLFLECIRGLEEEFMHQRGLDD